MVKILAFAGSTRRDSWNKKLLSVAAAAVREAGAEVTQIDLADFDIPLFSEDLETEGVPADVTRLKGLAAGHHGFLIASPEYNGSITPLLKNTIDWMSRRHGDEPPRMAYDKKVAAIVSASPGALGGIRAQAQLQYILQILGVVVVPQTVAVGPAARAFGESGELEDPRLAERLASLGQRLVATTRALHS